jgi:calcineurin-like phosphoesterase
MPIPPRIRILFIADIVGSPGLNILQTFLPSLLSKHKPDVVIANGENSHEGMGINEDICPDL